MERPRLAGGPHPDTPALPGRWRPISELEGVLRMGMLPKLVLPGSAVFVRCRQTAMKKMSNFLLRRPTWTALGIFILCGPSLTAQPGLLPPTARQLRESEAIGRSASRKTDI